MIIIRSYRNNLTDLNIYISQPIEFVRLLYDFKRVSDDNHEQIHHYRHREEHPAEHKDRAEERIKLNYFHESIRDLIAKHDTEQTEK